MSVVQTDHDFKLMVGKGRGEDALIGYLEKGNATIKGVASKAQKIGGMAVFPGYTKAWGRRVINGKVPTNRQMISVTDHDYKGEIEWLPYGADGGYLITARYVKGQFSLDYDYQVVVLRLPQLKDDMEGSYLQLPFGEQTIFSTDKAWMEFIQIHHINDDSVCKHPESEGSLFSIIKEYNSKAEKAKQIDKEWEAVSIVKSADDSFASLKLLKEIVSKLDDIVYDQKDESSLYDALKVYAKQQPERFLKCVDEYKANCSQLISMFESFEAFDLSKPGVIAITKPVKEVLVSDLDGKGEKLTDWLFQNCLKPEVNEIFNKLNQYSEKFK